MHSNHSARVSFGRALRDLKRLPRQFRNAFLDRLDVFPGLFFILLAFVTGHWTAMTLEEWVGARLANKPTSPDTVWLIIVLGMAFLLSSFLVWVYRHAFRQLQQRAYFRSDAAPKEGLVWFLSIQKELAEPLPAGPVTVLGVQLSRQPGKLVSDADALKAKSAEELDRTGKRISWKWEMLLRAVAPHESKLRRLYLIGSDKGEQPNEPGSIAQLSLCCNFLQPYLPNVEIVPWPHPTDFEDVVALDETLRDLVAREDSDGRGLHTLCVDVTGGQKPTSIAGAMATLDSRVTIQYVQTGGDKQPHTYDLVFYSPVEHAE
jgi:hypothetical protein